MSNDIPTSDWGAVTGWCRGARAGWSYEMRDLTTADLDWVDDRSRQSTRRVSSTAIQPLTELSIAARSQVDGELKGNGVRRHVVRLRRATIAATVEAEHVTVAGELTGEIRCRGRFQILPSGRVRANVSTGSS